MKLKIPAIVPVSMVLEKAVLEATWLICTKEEEISMQKLQSELVSSNYGERDTYIREQSLG